ncbi:MAG TPA: thioredoxin domain-containing protein [Candidatus Nanopelagicales bacterium]|nr:thioredoxin domain-containing protein [Candidatus Nanopelagicales bacterium]
MSNRLTGSSSPYLLQHAENPVDWWPWCDEAFEQARERNVPVLLSVGYAACHWCHVMAHESFEDPAIAQVMNDHFVNIKVDREERPDVDAVYMSATTALTGHGGWPMTVFLDHERRPFYAGTYFPPEPRSGMPSFRIVLEAISAAWEERRDDIANTAEQIATSLDRALPEVRTVDDQVVDRALASLRTAFDARFGGFGGAPKFPQPMVHEFLLRHHARTGEESSLAMVERTLTAMAAGGMYDQLAGGFARYSVDAQWLIPHFEKMLYDNALLLRVYVHWWRETGSELARRVVSETAEFLLDEMLTEQGCFAASLDADSEGREGTFYVWTPEQVREAGGDPAALGVTDAGTFEHGTSVLQRPATADWPRERLREVRAARPRPARDDKVVLAWNAWAVSALAEAGALLDEPAWVDAAVRCRDALWDLHEADGRWFRVSRDGVRGDALAVLEDYAALANAEFTLSAVTGCGPDRGLDLVAQLTSTFLDQGRDTAADDVLASAVDMSDNATPSGWNLAAEALLTASALTADAGLRARAETVLGQATHLAGYPQFWGHGLSVVEALLDGPREVAIVADVGSPLHRVALHGTAPGMVVATTGPLLEGRPRVDGLDTAYVCRGFVCDAPTTKPGVLAEQLRVRREV